ncbi:MAG: GGDEF domain-containing protein, partial [Brevinematales bacterium]
AFKDELTGVYNRRGIFQLLEQSFFQAQRYGLNLELYYCDLNDFKKINDTYGHLAGDYILKNLAGIINSFVGSQGLCSRWGGEEFLIFVPYRDKNDTKLFAEELRKRVEEEKFVYDNQTIKLTIKQQ